MKKLNKEQLRRLAEALKNRKLKKINNLKVIPLQGTRTCKQASKKTEKQILSDENKFVEHGIVLEKISPVLKPVARTQEGLEQISSSFLLQKRQEDKGNEKPYGFSEQKYFSKSGEYKTIDKIQTENLQTPSDIGREVVHMGIEQATKRKSERFFDEEQEKKYSADIKPLEEVKEKRKNNFYTPR